MFLHWLVIKHTYFSTLTVSDIDSNDTKLTCFSAVASSDIDGNNIELENFVSDDGMVTFCIWTQGHRESIHRTWKKKRGILWSHVD